MKRLIHAAAVLALFATASIASAAQGNTFIGLQFMSATADLATESSSLFTGFAPAYDHSEWGGKFEYLNVPSVGAAFVPALFSSLNSP